LVKIKHILLFVFLIFAFAAKSQKFETQLSSNQIQVGQRLKVSYVLNSKGTNFRGPKFYGFQVLSGPNQSTSMQIVNGNMSSSITYSYILQAVKEGTHTIKGARIDAEGKALTSNDVNVRVIKAQNSSQHQANTQQNNNQNQPQGQNQQTQPTNDKITDNLFIKVYANKTKAFVGEEIIVTYKVYTRVNIVNNGINKLPDFTGFWALDIESAAQGRLEQTTYNGVAFNVATIKQSALIPQKAGKLEIDPLIMDVVVRLRDNNRPRSIFDQFFGGFKDVNYQIKSNKITIETSPLPSAGKPKDFTGAVGKFSISSIIDKDSLEANDAINFKVTYSGNGNIKFVQAPKINFPPDFEVYDPKASEKVSVNASGISGTKTFEYLIIPRHEGKFVIPELSFSYFDVASKSYKNLKTKPFPIQVGKSNNTEAATAYRSVKKEEIKLLGKDIRFIKTNQQELKERNISLFNSPIHYFGLGLSSLALIAFLFFAKTKQRSKSDLLDAKSKKAAKLASKKLKDAQNELKSGNKEAFYEKLLAGLYNYFSNKLSIPVADLSKESIETGLQKFDTSAGLIEETKEVILICEIARFAPVTSLNEEETFTKANNLIQNVEKAI
jgi:hypothetical protein